MNVLALDTATEVLSASLIANLRDPAGPERVPSGRTRVLSVTRDVGLRHSRLLMTLIRGLLADAGLTAGQIDLVACTRGPGSFTGLRIGMASAKGLAAAIAAVRGETELRIVSVPSLDVFAARVPSGRRWVIPVVDGRKGRFYAAIFRDDARMTPDLDLAATDILTRLDAVEEETDASATRGSIPAIITGPHAQLFTDVVRGAVEAHRRIVVDPVSRAGTAEILAARAAREFRLRGADPPGQGPVYVRSSDAELSRRPPHREQ